MSAQHEEDYGLLSRSTEAPLSSNFYWTFGRGEVFNIQTTIREGILPEQLEEHLESLKEAMLKVIEMGGHAKPVGQQPAPRPDPAYANGNGKHAEQEEARRNLDVTYEDVPRGDYDAYEDATQVVILPQPGDVVNLEFYKEGLQFAVVKITKWKYAQAAGLLKHITDAPVDKPAKLSIPCRVFFKHGKEYTYADKRTGEPKTGRYRDVTHVRPL